MSTDQQHTSKSWGHRLRQENRGLREKIAQLKKESNVLQKDLKNTWKLMSNIPAALFLVQQEKIIFANETACRELGYTSKEILAKTLQDLLHPDSISFTNALQQKRPMDQILPGQNETFLTAKSGQTLCYEVRVNKIRYQGKTAFLLNMVKEGEFAINLEDEIVKGSLLVHDGQVVHELIKPLMEQKGE